MPVATLSMVGMMLVVTDIAPLHIATLSKGMDDRRALVDYDLGDGIWGVHEFLPNYAKVPRACDQAAGTQKVTFGELRAGVRAQTPFLIVRHAPVGLVDYNAGGTVLQSAACEADLVLGPLLPGAIVTVSESRMDLLLWIRIASFAVALLAVWWLIPFGRWRLAT